MSELYYALPRPASGKSTPTIMVYLLSQEKNGAAPGIWNPSHGLGEELIGAVPHSQDTSEMTNPEVIVANLEIQSVLPWKGKLCASVLITLRTSTKHKVTWSDVTRHTALLERKGFVHNQALLSL